MLISILLGTLTHFAWAKPEFSFQQQVSALEKLNDGKIGVYALNLKSQNELAYRSDERFAFCSTFKVIVVAAILKKAETDATLLDSVVRFTKADIARAGYAPITEKKVGHGMKVAELCAATLQYSDNGAVNLLMKGLGGIPAVNAFAKSIGDETFRLDRGEPALNSAKLGDARDTTTPKAMAKTLLALVAGDALSPEMKNRFVNWLKGNTTGDHRIRAGVPRGSVVADKTGTGSYGVTNDIGVIWPATGFGVSPIVLAVYFRQNKKTAHANDAVVAEVTRLVFKDAR